MCYPLKHSTEEYNGKVYGIYKEDKSPQVNIILNPISQWGYNFSSN